MCIIGKEEEEETAWALTDLPYRGNATIKKLDKNLVFDFDNNAVKITRYQ